MRALAGRTLKRLREIGAMAAEGEADHLLANATDHTARGMAAIECGQYRRIASRAPAPSYHARSAQTEAVPGNDDGVEGLGISPV
ncbi:hypothetical protein [Paraburkholderia sacchari]|uniref:hypothetical protein n=1 Tax=Paraburkholderia sacchari TaxID=159450 RepID=UPI001BD18BE9|nr:hypothetical protein [Paraburkholderia sacchari]